MRDHRDAEKAGTGESVGSSGSASPAGLIGSADGRSVEEGLAEEPAADETLLTTVEASPWPARIFRLGLFSLVACALTLGLLLMQYRQLGRLQREAMTVSVRAGMARALHRLNPVLRGAETSIRALLATPTPLGAAHESAVPAALRAILESHPEAEACGALVPFSSTALRAVRTPQGIDVQPLSPADIAGLKKQAAEPGWQEPVLDAPRRTVALRYLATQPLSPETLAYIDLSQAAVRAIIDDIDPGDRGFSTLLSKGGQFIVLPEQEAVLGGAHVHDASHGTPLHHLASRPPGPSGELSFYAQGILGRIMYEPVTGTGWTLAVTWLVEEYRDSRELQRLLLWIGIVAIFTLCGLVVTLLSRGYEGSRCRLWVGSALVTLFLLCGTLFTWYLVLADRLDQAHRPATWSDIRLHGTSPQLSDPAAISRFEQIYRQFCRDRKRPAPTFVPTGVWLDSLEFTTANNVKLSGFIWQRYPARLSADVPRGIQIPDALDLKLTEEERRTDGDTQVIRWRFEGTVRQRIDYSRYPLDRATVRLRVLPRALPRTELMPVPDAAAYVFLKPREAPGVRDDIVLSGWTVRESRFAYLLQGYDSDFGTNDPNTIRLEFCFEVDLQRDFLHAFIVNLVPFFVIAGLLFALLVITSRDEGLSSRFGVTATGVLSTCSGLLFATLLSHSKLRTDFASQGSIIYLEYLYFILYFLICAVPLHAFLAAADVRIPLLSDVSDGDDMLPKLLFWPFVLAVILALSIWFFY